jgi:hypothetical protein
MINNQYDLSVVYFQKEKSRVKTGKVGIEREATTKRDVARDGERARANQDVAPGDINLGAGHNTNHYFFFILFLVAFMLWHLTGSNVNMFWNENLFKNYSNNDFFYSVRKFHVIMKIF